MVILKRQQIKNLKEYGHQKKGTQEFRAEAEARIDSYKKEPRVAYHFYEI